VSTVTEVVILDDIDPYGRRRLRHWCGLRLDETPSRRGPRDRSHVREDPGRMQSCQRRDMSPRGEHWSMAVGTCRYVLQLICVTSDAVDNLLVSVA